MATKHTTPPEPKEDLHAQAPDPTPPLPFDCSKFDALGETFHEGMRAATDNATHPLRHLRDA